MSNMPEHRPIDILLPRLSRVRQTGPSQWVACCPGPIHRRGDRSPSLSIRESGSGSLLLYCFAGDTAAEIVAAIGLALSALFPQRPNNGRDCGNAAPPIRLIDAFRGIETDLLALSLALNDVARGVYPEPADAAYIASRADHFVKVLDEVRNAHR